jgi:hypothetical protein
MVAGPPRGPAIFIFNESNEAADAKPASLAHCLRHFTQRDGPYFNPRIGSFDYHAFYEQLIGLVEHYHCFRPAWAAAALNRPFADH